MTTFSKWILLGACATFGAAAYGQEHPLLPRLQGLKLTKSTVTQFDEIPIVTGPAAAQLQKLEGKITHVEYETPQDRSTLEIFRAYQGVLQQQGFQTIFSCSGQSDCGDRDPGRFYNGWTGGCPNEPMRYISAKLSRPTGDAYVSLQVSNGGCGPGKAAVANIIEIQSSNLTTLAPVQPVDPAPRNAAPAPVNMPAAAPVQVAGGGREVPAGATLVVRMIDSIDSQRDRVGQVFRASLDAPLNDDRGNTILQRGADVQVRLVDDQQAGRLAGRTVLTIKAISVQANGRMVDIDTGSVAQRSGSQTGRTATRTAIGAGIGAAIGAAIGGGKGAAIGAGAGGAAGATSAALSGQRVVVPSETTLSFQFAQPARF